MSLACWIRWLECHPIHQKLVGLIPGQGTGLAGLCVWPLVGACTGGDWPMFLSNINVSHSLSFSLPLSLKPINISSGEDLKNNTKVNFKKSKNGLSQLLWELNKWTHVHVLGRSRLSSPDAKGISQTVKGLPSFSLPPTALPPVRGQHPRPSLLSPGVVMELTVVGSVCPSPGQGAWCHFFTLFFYLNMFIMKKCKHTEGLKEKHNEQLTS